MDNNKINNSISNEESPFVSSDELYGKKLKPTTKPEKNIGIDLSSQVFNTIIDTYQTSAFDMSRIESFTRLSQDREQIYQMLDTMAEDSMIAAVLEIYAEDATETNDQGQIVWAEAADPDIHKFVSYLLNSINVDKYIYSWAYSLCKYGDLYLKLFHESDIDDGLFNGRKKETLNEDVILKAYSKQDKFVHYIEQVANPAEIFELTKFGKTYAYIEAPLSYNYAKTDTSITVDTFKYRFRKNDVSIYEPTEYVHATLDDNSSRVPEEVEIFMDEEDPLRSKAKLSYKVRRGQSLLYNTFKIWREMMLLENAMLLNRLTKSALVRIINVEVGDMPKEQIGPHLMGIKQMMEQKAAINTGNSLREYTNPGAIENNIYVPTHNGQGALSTQQVGGDVDVKGLADIDFFKNKLYSALRVPKQFLGDTDDGAGFNGGTSLSIISSRYAKMVKRIQNTLIQAITDCLNLMLIDKGLDSYINKFTIRMQEPTTQEEMDRRSNLSTKIQSVSDIINLTSDIQDPVARLKILKSLISNVISDSDVLNIIQEEINKLEIPTENQTDVDDTSVENTDLDMANDIGVVEPQASTQSTGDMTYDQSSEQIPDQSDNGYETVGELPSPEALGAGDFTDNSGE